MTPEVRRRDHDRPRDRTPTRSARPERTSVTATSRSGDRTRSARRQRELKRASSHINRRVSAVPPQTATSAAPPATPFATGSRLAAFCSSLRSVHPQAPGLPSAWVRCNGRARPRVRTARRPPRRHDSEYITAAASDLASGGCRARRSTAPRVAGDEPGSRRRSRLGEARVKKW